MYIAARPGQHHRRRLRAPCRGRRAWPRGGRGAGAAPAGAGPGRSRLCRAGARAWPWANVPRRTVDEVQIAGLDRVDPAVVQRYVSQGAGDPLDTSSAEPRPAARLRRRLVRERGLHAARPARPQGAAPAAGGKELGPGLPAPGRAAGVQPEPGLHLRAARRPTRRPGSTRWAANCCATAALGSTTGLGVELHQPLDAAQRCLRGRQGRLLARAQGLLLRATSASPNTAGPAPAANSARASTSACSARRAWAGARRRSPTSWKPAGLCRAAERRPHHAQRRLAAGAGHGPVRPAVFPAPRLGAPTPACTAIDRDGYSRLDAAGAGAWPWQSWVLGARASWVDSPQGQLPFNEAGALGGFLNLSGLCHGQLLGDGVAYAHVRAERIIGTPAAGPARRHAAGPGAGSRPRGPALHGAEARRLAELAGRLPGRRDAAGAGVRGAGRGSDGSRPTPTCSSARLTPRARGRRPARSPRLPGTGHCLQPPSPATACRAACRPCSTMRCFHASVSV